MDFTGKGPLPFVPPPFGVEYKDSSKNPVKAKCPLHYKLYFLRLWVRGVDVGYISSLVSLATK